MHLFCTDLFKISGKLSMTNYLVKRSKDGKLANEYIVFKLERNGKSFFLNYYVLIKIRK